MADIALLLLIFFLATTLIEMQGGPVVVLPEAQSAEEQRREGAVVVRIARGGAATIEGRPVAMEDLGTALTRERRGRERAKVMLFADRSLECRSVLAAVAALRGEESVPLVLAVDRGAAEPQREERAR
jgi:biopolymer transport protein ExbD